MTAIARALSRAFVTINDVELLKQLVLFWCSRPVHIPAVADLRRGSEPGLFLNLHDG